MYTPIMQRSMQRLVYGFVLLFALLAFLPAHAERLPELINRVKPGDIFPNATRFGTPEGENLRRRQRSRRGVYHHRRGQYARLFQQTD